MIPSAETLARLHALCFVRPRPWRAEEFAALLDSPGVLPLTSQGGFLLGRMAAGEAELLTLAIAPTARRTGQGATLVGRFLAAARAEACTVAFLEVAADNGPAQALYRRTGWVEAGRRRNYYAPGVDAVVMRHDLGGDGVLADRPSSARADDA